ncbi:hypothetical protein LOTGIDRAFT_159233 [Lottia gigantea]|uniref:HSF-type DNA-binding domain-containing protein n=1 Tax=Lottia gigantea TaxID=225164 RepID=V4AU25_LOTGI|nr:hypothetical protein LOTGIDRAFT_159233 [Lottia gigantea]ESO98425.1 hypothetical protein LOTGIDRAFT_159233 [Lottia gigantea]
MPKTLAPKFRFGFSNAVKTDRFPEKLYEVASDDYLIRWNENGTSVFVDEEGFADVVMDCYPGFLQIPDFANIRRLFREYGFDWNHEGSVFEFSHPSFVRGNPEILCEVLTRRKSFCKSKSSRKTNPNPLFKSYREDFDNSDDEIDLHTKEPGIMTRRGFIPYNKQVDKTTEKSPKKIKFDEKKAYKIHERPSLISGKENKKIEISEMETEEQDETLRKGGFEENKRAIENIINVFALNELSPEEFLEYLQRKRSKPISHDNSSAEYCPTLLPMMKTDNNEIKVVPFQCEFETQDYPFTQIRPINYQPRTEDILPSKDYHIMENISIADNSISRGNCTCNCHMVCSQ